jgi:hypothetical protein
MLTKILSRGFLISVTFLLLDTGSSVRSQPGAGTTLLPQNCGLENRSRSPVNSRAITIQFINNSSFPVKVYWIDFQGKRQHYFDLEPSQSRELPTYINHPWLITRRVANQPCISIYIPNQVQNIAIIQ